MKASKTSTPYKSPSMRRNYAEGGPVKSKKDLPEGFSREFTKARAQGKKTFQLGGKTYKATGGTEYGRPIDPSTGRRVKDEPKKTETKTTKSTRSTSSAPKKSPRPAARKPQGKPNPTARAGTQGPGGKKNPTAGDGKRGPGAKAPKRKMTRSGPNKEARTFVEGYRRGTTKGKANPTAADGTRGPGGAKPPAKKNWRRGLSGGASIGDVIKGALGIEGTGAKTNKGKRAGRKSGSGN